MIFFLGRCVFEPETWNFDAYYSNNEIWSEDFAEEKGKELSLTGCHLEDFIKSHTCKQYAVLRLYFRDRQVFIQYYDNDIDYILNEIKKTLCDKSSFIDLSSFDFYDTSEAY